MEKHHVPDLPPMGEPITLRDCVRLGLVPGRRPPSAAMLQRWATRGCRVISGGVPWLFPTIRGPRDRLTCAEWCDAWVRHCARVRLAEAGRVAAIVSACRAAAGV